ncbi:MAG: polysaccharide deacetylase family protein [Gammaproteobacteria bacterium]|nr:polysaccharide deacetylase family protein [Gammaproteobacteria bacterium]
MFKEKLIKPVTALVNLTPNRLVRSVCGQLVPIFFLHRLYPGYDREDDSILKHLSWCLEYIRSNGYTPIRLIDLIEARINQTALPKNPVVFTLDDGFDDQYELALPLFNQFDTPYTCFVISKFLDGELWPWDDQIRYVVEQTALTQYKITLPDQSIVTATSDDPEQVISQLHHHLKLVDQSNLYDWIDSFYQQLQVDKPKQAPLHYRPMSWHQAQAIIDNGHDIAPHTMTHRILSRLNDQQSEQEIIGSWDRTCEMLNGVAPVFAYPTGRITDYGRREMATIARSSIKCAVSTVPGHVREASENENLPRFVLPDNRFDFVQYLSFIEALKQRFAK